MKHPFGCNTLTTGWWREQSEENGITAMHSYRDQQIRKASIRRTAIWDGTQFRLESSSLRDEGFAKAVAVFAFMHPLDDPRVGGITMEKGIKLIGLGSVLRC